MRKELRSLIISPAAMIFLLLFVGISGTLLWVFPGAYNIREGGYATMEAFFALTPILLAILVPVLSMKSFSEEKKSKTLDLLLTRPVNTAYIVASKMTAVFCLVLTAFLLSTVHLYLVSGYALPEGNIDWGSIAGSYLGLILFSLTIISLSVFASSVTSNQILACMAGVAGSFTLYYGFDLLASLSTGNTAVCISRWGLLSHVQSVNRGVVENGNLLAIFFYSGLFYVLTCQVISVRKSPYPAIVFLAILSVLYVSARTWHWRLDLTAEKRYTLSDSSISLFKNADTQIKATVYLEGRLNPGFTRLRRALFDLLSDLRHAAPGKLEIHFEDPYRATDHAAFVRQLQDKGVRGVTVNESNREGSFIQTTLFPYLEVSCKDHSITVPLLINQTGKSGEENLNASIENLEYALAKAVNSLLNNKERRIAFLEGHGELPEEAVQDITDRLSLYYSIDRGAISGRKGELNDYELIVIAGAQSPFSEQEKFVLDQYLMQGGKLFLLLNGVLLDYRALAEEGESASMPNDTRLDDMLFHYGLRINPILINDLQCLSIPVSVQTEERNAASVRSVRWPYAPLLNPNEQHPVCKNLLHVKSEFASSIDFTGKDQAIRKTPLLLTSEYSRVINTPEMIRLNIGSDDINIEDFNKSNLIVAAALEGCFTSVFEHRAIPEGIETDNNIITKSRQTKIIVAASEEIIRNREGYTAGYDPYSRITFGNADFVVNAAHYLTDDEGLMQLRNKHLVLRLLDKNKMRDTTARPLLYALIFPIALISAGWLGVALFRKRKYGRY